VVEDFGWGLPVQDFAGSAVDCGDGVSEFVFGGGVDSGALGQVLADASVEVVDLVTDQTGMATLEAGDGGMAIEILVLDFDHEWAGHLASNIEEAGGEVSQSQPSFD
jgi:hypothetical protein